MSIPSENGNLPLPRLFAAESVEIVLPIPSKSASFTEAPSGLNVEPGTVFDAAVNVSLLSILTTVSFDDPNSVGMLAMSTPLLEDDVDVITRSSG